MDSGRWWSGYTDLCESRKESAGTGREGQGAPEAGRDSGTGCLAEGGSLETERQNKLYPKHNAQQNKILLFPHHLRNTGFYVPKMKKISDVWSLVKFLRLILCFSPTSAPVPIPVHL